MSDPTITRNLLHASPETEELMRQVQEATKQVANAGLSSLYDKQWGIGIAIGLATHNPWEDERFDILPNFVCALGHLMGERQATASMILDQALLGDVELRALLAALPGDEGWKAIVESWMAMPDGAGSFREEARACLRAAYEALVAKLLNDLEVSLQHAGVRVETLKASFGLAASA